MKRLWPSIRTWQAAAIPFAFPRWKNSRSTTSIKERNYAMALEFTLTALSHSDSDALRHRKARLERRLPNAALRPV